MGFEARLQSFNSRIWSLKNCCQVWALHTPPDGMNFENILKMLYFPDNLKRNEKNNQTFNIICSAQCTARCCLPISCFLIVSEGGGPHSSHKEASRQSVLLCNTLDAELCKLDQWLTPTSPKFLLCLKQELKVHEVFKPNALFSAFYHFDQH